MRERDVAQIKALCIFTNLLGNKATASRFLEALQSLSGVETACVSLGLEDYRKYPAPRWARMTNLWETQYIARRKAQQSIAGAFDILLVNSWELAVAFRGVARRFPAAALMDGTPTTIHQQLARRGIAGWKRDVAYRLSSRPFQAAAREFGCFLPMGSDCAESLHHDYGIPRDRCFVTLAPQDLGLWQPAQRTFRAPLKLLFAGNDFARKGGDFLLELYARHLAGSHTLTIASNDPSLSERRLPAGVEWLRGRTREQLAEVYRSHDLLLFPTRQDYMPQVLAEALATGLPCVATAIGGIPDLVRDGETGALMPFGAPLEAWARRVAELAGNPAELEKLSTGARKFAEERLGLERFRALVKEVVGRLSRSEKGLGADKRR